MQHFLQNKYTKWYSSLVSKARRENRVRTEGVLYHRHHIIPRSLGGDESSDNLVLLTPREHYICHLLLTRMVTGKAKSKMVFAFFRFKPKGSNLSSHEYAEMVEAVSGSLNPYFGRKHSEATRIKISANHGMRGRSSYTMWVEWYGLEKADEMQTDLRDRRSKIATGTGNHMWGKKHSEEWRSNHAKMMSGERNPNFGKAKAWVHLNGVTKSILKEEVGGFLSEGWSEGRGAMKPRLWVYRREEGAKQIDPDTLASYLGDGWERGRGGRRTRH